MRLTLRSSLAMRALMYCAVNDRRLARKHEIALACNASENHLGQVIHHLGQLGYLATRRGRSGGVTLARPMAAIRVGAVLRDLEAGIPFAECLAPGADTCPIAGCCRLRPALQVALEAFYGALDDLTLADLVKGNGDLAGLLGDASCDGSVAALATFPACAGPPRGFAATA